MAVKSADQALSAWKAAMASPVTQQNYSAGINAVQNSPMEAAANRVDAYQQGVAAAVANGKYVNNLRAVPLSQWKTAATNVGAGRLGTGAVKASPKYQAFAQKWSPIWAQQQAAAAAVQGPKGQATALAKFQASLAIQMQASGKS